MSINTKKPTEAPGISPHFLTSNMSHGGQLTLWSMRQWLVSVRQRRCIKRDLIQVYIKFDCTDAIVPLDQMMRELAASAFRPIAICCPHANQLSDDELAIVKSLQGVQRGDWPSAEKHACELMTRGLYQGYLNAAKTYVGQLADVGLSVCGLTHLSLASDNPSNSNCTLRNTDAKRSS